MPGVDVGVVDTAQAAGVFGVDVALRPSPDQSTTTTADPGTAGTTLAVTNGSLRFPAANNFFVRVDNEYMFVTGGAGTNSWTVTRGVTPPSTVAGTGVAHSIGATVSLMVGVQRVSPVLERLTTFQGLVAGNRTVGTAAVPHNLFTIENGAGSTVLVAVKKLSVEMDATAAQLAVAPEFLTTRPTGLPTGGTPMTKTGGYDTALTSNASVIIRAAADATSVASAITATAGGTRLYHQFQMRMATQVGQMLPDDWNCIPYQCYDDPIILRASEALLVQVIGTAGSNAATNHYVAKVVWEEYKLP
jgi:hypothetical protein